VNARDKGAKILNEARKKKASVKLVITRRRGDSLEEVTGRVEGDIGDVAIVSTDSEIIAIPTEEIVAARRSLPLTTQFWCADLMTVCWNEEIFGFAGLRLLVEPSFSFAVPVQRKGFSFSPVNIANSVAIGLEINLVGAWLAGQTYIVSPHSTDLTAADGMTTAAAKSKAGIAFGLSLLNGVVGVGWGLTFWDRTTLPDFASELRNRGAANSQFIYIAIQPVTALRTAFTAIKNGRRKAAAKNE
ncbi:MAG: hypothetical protein KC636_21670, partial [Myxococcales bacterium]|nr:hypothetical protein [Myxococcales bacterium]